MVCLLVFNCFIMFYQMHYGILLNHIQNLEAVDAKQRYPKEYTTWREDPANFRVNGIYPVLELWGTAREAWKEILLAPVRFSSAVMMHIDVVICPN